MAIINVSTTTQYFKKGLIFFILGDVLIKTNNLQSIELSGKQETTYAVFC